jgi:hypothetical protein
VDDGLIERAETLDVELVDGLLDEGALVDADVEAGVLDFPTDVAPWEPTSRWT